MKVKLPIMIQDQYESKRKELGFFEDVTLKGDLFLNGPVAPQVAVLDFDPVSHELQESLKFTPPAGDQNEGGYLDYQGKEYWRDFVEKPEFIQASVFAAVMDTIAMYEEADNLGRSITWAFEAPQLLVVPRAGDLANAYYERESHSLQFFSFKPEVKQTVVGPIPETIYTALSRDIIAHETAHALLDGIAPSLYDAFTPQSLALHESVADLSAVLMAFRSDKLREKILEQTHGRIYVPTAYNAMATEFGTALQGAGGRKALRDLMNKRNLCPDDVSIDRYGEPNRVSRSNPHALSEVLSGALYAVMVEMHCREKRKIAQQEGITESSASGKALVNSGRRFKRMILRALDYLPPGEVSFADYGRAIIAADQASYPTLSKERDWIVDQFVRRCIVPNRDALKVKTNTWHKCLEGLDLERLITSDWYAYEFARKYWRFLSIPSGDTPFQIEPRLKVKKKFYHPSGDFQVEELLFKVKWDQVEPNSLGFRYPSDRNITVGTTLVIDCGEKRQVRAVLTSDHSKRPDEAIQQKRDRDQLLQKLVEEGVLKMGRSAFGPGGKQLRSAISAEDIDGVMHVRSMAKMLHIANEVEL